MALGWRSKLDEYVDSIFNSGDQAFFKQAKVGGGGRGRGKGRGRGRGSGGAQDGQEERVGRNQDGFRPPKKKADLSCFVCDKKGHMARECPDRK